MIFLKPFLTNNSTVYSGLYWMNTFWINIWDFVMNWIIQCKNEFSKRIALVTTWYWLLVTLPCGHLTSVLQIWMMSLSLSPLYDDVCEIDNRHILELSLNSVIKIKIKIKIQSCRLAYCPHFNIQLSLNDGLLPFHRRTNG